MQFAAEGTFEEIDAPAPSSSVWPTCALTVTDRTKASSARMFAPAVAADVGFAVPAGQLMMTLAMERRSGRATNKASANSANQCTNA